MRRDDLIRIRHMLDAAREASSVARGEDADHASEEGA